MESRAYCNICEKTFSKHSNLRFHVKNFHPDKLEEIASNKTRGAAIDRQDKKVTCAGCNKNFAKNKNLMAHIRKIHPDKVDDLLPEKVFNYECDVCHNRFTHLRHFKTHLKGHNVPSMSSSISGIKCAMCNYKKSSKKELICHYSQVHNIAIQTEQVTFATLEDFQSWKSSIEKSTKSCFVKEYGAKTIKDCVKTKYVCHRSGTYRGRGDKIRHLKIGGSNKINGFCPAGLSVVYQNGACEVTYIKSHVGHEQSLGHISLTVSERCELATKIAAKIPLPTIIDEVRDSIDKTTELERLHLLTKKDLYNIEQSFNLNSTSVRHKNDAVSVEAWVNEMSDRGAVLFYKPQDTDCADLPNLKKEDFVLVIMNQGQKNILQKYGNDCICMDKTHGMNAYGFELISLLILDDIREGFPCAFLISNRSDEETLKIMLFSIREQLGYKITPLVFMSDMAESFYNAWVIIMEPPKFRLYCTWHVDRAWRKNLNKIVSREKQVIVYQQLRALLQETDVVAFERMLNHFQTFLSQDQDKVEFAQYFTAHYANKTKSWGYCHRLCSGLNTNMHIERMHRTLKYLYLDGKCVKRLDKAINGIMKFVRDKLFERLIVGYKGKLCTKIQVLRSRHKMSESLCMDSITTSDEGWQVQSSSSSEIYIVEERTNHCTCKIICTDCDACLHQYSCTCLDSCIKWNMCKHIHLICRYRKSILASTQEKTNNAAPIEREENDNNLLIHIDPSNAEVDDIYKSLSSSSISSNTHLHGQSLQQKKDDMKKWFCGIVDSIQLESQFDALANLVAPIEPTLKAAVVQTTKNPDITLKERIKVPLNKKIEQQRRFYSTKRKNKRPNKFKIPTMEEQNKIAMSLLNNSS